MQKATLRKIRHLSPIKHRLIRKSKNDSHNHLARLHNVYTNSLDTVKENPYSTLGVMLGLSVVSGVLIWYTLKK